MQLQFEKIAVTPREHLIIHTFQEFISQVYVSGEAVKIEQGECITISKTDKVLQFFLPKSLRIDANSL